MSRRTIRDLLRSLESAGPEQQWPLLCWLAGTSVELDPGERHAALRRAELLLATGGDPRRALDLYGRAVTALASDLDEPGARAQLASGLAALEPEAAGLRGASEALRLLRGDADLAWQCYALALLADTLGDDQEP